MRGREVTGRGRRAGTRLAATVLGVGLALAAAAGIAVHVVERHSADQIMDRRAGLAEVAVSTEVRRYLDTLRTIAAAMGTDGDLTQAEYLAATAPLVDA